MEETTPELITYERAKDVQGRRLYTREQREELIRKYEQSGLTQRAFSQQEGIKENTFLGWLEYRKQGYWSQTKRKQAIKFEQVELSQGVQTCMEAKLEVILGDGTRIRGDNVQSMAALIKAIKS